jgi:hypothetical protein
MACKVLAVVCNGVSATADGAAPATVLANQAAAMLAPSDAHQCLDLSCHSIVAAGGSTP